MSGKPRATGHHGKRKAGGAGGGGKRGAKQLEPEPMEAQHPEARPSPPQNSEEQPRSRKRKATDPAADPACPTAEEAATDAAFWRAKFYELQTLRETEPEQRLADLKASIREQEATMNKVVEVLRGELSLDAVVPQSTPLDAELSSRVHELEAKVASQRACLKVYQLLTSVVFEDIEQAEAEHEGPDVDAYLAKCVAVNHVHKKALKFEVGYNSATRTTQFAATGNSHLLPPQLRKSVSFAAEQTPVLVHKMLGSLYQLEAERAKHRSSPASSQGSPAEALTQS